MTAPTAFAHGAALLSKDVRLLGEGLGRRIRRSARCTIPPPRFWTRHGRRERRSPGSTNPRNLVTDPFSSQTPFHRGLAPIDETLGATLAAAATSKPY